MCVHISRHCVCIQITSPGYFLQAFLPLFILFIPGPCSAARRNAFYCQSKHVCAVDVWSILPPWQACHGRMKKNIDRKGRGKNYFLQHWEYFPLLYKELLCGERGQDEKYMSSERIFPWQPAHALFQLCFSYRKMQRVFLLYPHPVW